MTFAERLKELREGREWSQSDLARRAGLKPQTINQLESGRNKRPDLMTLCRLAKAFDISLDKMAGPICDQLASEAA